MARPRGGRCGSGQSLAGDLAPAQDEVPRHVGDGRSSDDGRDVVPAEAPARGMTRPVEPVAGEIGEIDAAHERQLVVDDDELLVMAMQRPLVRVERAHDLIALAERLADPSYDPSRKRVQR